MKTYTVNILASDFKDNSYWNINPGEKGCPMERALQRAGTSFLTQCPFINTLDEAHSRIYKMFKGKEPIVDFSFTFEGN